MKKLFLALTLVSFATVTFAQGDLTNKKGVSILPEVGEWAIGIDAVPFLDYVGNAFNNTSNSAPSWSYPNSTMKIQGLLVKENGKRYRANARIGFGSSKQETGDTASGSASENKSNSNFIGLGAGIQQSRGKGRVQGMYGAEANIGFGGGKTETSYNGTPSAGSTLEVKQGSTFDLGIRAFIGVEYFFAAKMSIAGEFGWGLGFSSTGEEETTFYDGTSNVTQVTTGKSNSFGIDTDNSGGSIIMSFYF
jgi:hypothetical protein